LICSFLFFKVFTLWEDNLLLIKVLMSLAVFYCLANILLFTILFIYSTSYIASKSTKNINIIQKDLKQNLEKIYNLSSYEDSVHN